MIALHCSDRNCVQMIRGGGGGGGGFANSVIDRRHTAYVHTNGKILSLYGRPT